MQKNILKELAEIVSEQSTAINKWYQGKLKNNCLYSSVDIRYSGSKLAPVDTNLFPAGFNNLDTKNIEDAAKEINGLLPAQKILLIGENHTRNLHYLDNLKTLQNIFNSAGYVCEIATLESESANFFQGVIHSNIQINQIIRNNNKLQTQAGFIPDLIVLNNDLSSGLPDKFNNISQKIIPNPNYGWFKRRKFHHFTIYNSLLEELENLFGIPKFFLTTEIDLCTAVNFKERHGLEELSDKVEAMLALLQQQYDKYNIKDKPYVVIKSNYGTYGMGIMIAKSKQDIVSINQKHRRQMHITKSNIVNNEVILQEGIKTIDLVNNEVAEPLLYLMNHQQVAFLHRVHQEKDEYSNLNSVGMKIINNRLLSKLGSGSEFEGGSERTKAVYMDVHGYSSTEPTYKLPAEIEFRKKSNQQNIDEYYISCNFIARIATLAASLEN